MALNKRDVIHEYFQLISRGSKRHIAALQWDRLVKFDGRCLREEQFAIDFNSFESTTSKRSHEQSGRCLAGREHYIVVENLHCHIPLGNAKRNGRLATIKTFAVAKRMLCFTGVGPHKT